VRGGERKMDCRKVDKLLSQYLDNSLDVSCKDKIKSHLDGCKECMSEFNAMAKVDELIKLKAKETPSREYFKNYWQRLKSKLDKNDVQQLPKDRIFLNPFFTRVAFAFNGILIVFLIFLGSLLYVHSQRIRSLELVQEETQKVWYQYLSHLRTKIGVMGNMQTIDKTEERFIINRFPAGKSKEKEVFL
jgi:anti-sigma factor (TIGR02949 family)